MLTNRNCGGTCGVAAVIGWRRRPGHPDCGDFKVMLDGRAMQLTVLATMAARSIGTHSATASDG